MLDTQTIKKRFLALNRDRVTRIRDTLRPRQRDVIEVLPLLFHINHPELPGFVSAATPVGVSDYSPSRRALEVVQKMVRALDYRPRALPRFDIFSLFLMGSSGTIAYSTKSDFDVWLCHNPDLSAVQLAELQEKARALETWAATFDLEVHFFLMNCDHFRAGKVVELSDESSGSAQHHLLLDEFYRTGVLLAGRYPVWWLVPPREEAEYDRYVRRLRERGEVGDNETVDFGGLPRAPAEEFFGAALWQLYKSIDSPYKAALKLMLTEVYAAEYPQVELLSLRFKRALQEGETDLTRLDPYIMLYRRIEEYLSAQGDDERLAVMRRCFYFKVNEQLGRQEAPQDNWRYEVMKEFARAWGWNHDYLQTLDTRLQWKIHQVLEERRSLVSALTQSYHSLSRFARVQNMLARINQRDLNILGRKLYAAFERKAGKVDIVNRGISNDIWESHLSIHQLGGRDNGGWTLHRGVVPPEEGERSKPFKRSRVVTEMLAWGFFNQLVDERTTFALFTRDSALGVNEVKSILRGLDHLVPGSQLGDSTLEALSQPPRLAGLSLFINVGLKPATLREREGKELTSNKTDALSFGGVCENLVLSIDQVARTTWQEVMVSQYEGEQGLLDCLAAYLQWSPPSTGIPPPAVTAHCFSSTQSAAVVRRIEELFRDVADCYYRAPQTPSARYILLIGTRYYALQLDNDTLRHTRLDTYNDLLKYLAAPAHAHSPVVIDRHALSHDILPAIYRNNKAGVVQFYYVEEATAIYVYFIDERGSLFCRRMPRMDIHLLVQQYRRFLAAVGTRLDRHKAPERALDAQAVPLEIYQAFKKYHGRSQLVRHREQEAGEGQRYFNVQVIAGVSDNHRPEFTIYIDAREFSSLEFGDGLFREAAAYVLERRKSGLRYPIYITDIDLSHRIAGVAGADQMQTVHYLEYKKTIEERLNRALATLIEDNAAGLAG
ncbi:MAG: class I adenylate cyclase [Gammaproteobacteria bacterium]|nr:class I adenylate cyclase [Gammaproteobacteria bacterium]